MCLQISGQTYGELRIVPDMHTRKVSLMRQSMPALRTCKLDTQMSIIMMRQMPGLSLYVGQGYLLATA